jgi:hypothetical protein
MSDCITCGQTVSCLCSGPVGWSVRVRRAMVCAREAQEAYRVAWAEHPLRRLELRDALETAQGRVLDLQWVQLGDAGYAR